MTPPHTLFHSLLRPAILQILRATGFHSAKTSVLDAVTDLAERYLYHLCELTALYAAHNDSLSETADLAPTIVDVRLALQRAGALLPERLEGEQGYLGSEDMRGLEEFLAWAAGPQNREIKRIALDGNDEAVDYLDGEFASSFGTESSIMN
jgi:transcription initiation factor TFIID subunit 3